MPHNQEVTTAELSAHSPFIDGAWREKHKKTILNSCTPTDKAILHGLYRRPELCEEEDSLIPWIKAKHRRYVIASFERDAKAIRQVLAKHYTLLTLSAYFDFPAEHRIVNILHQYLRNSIDVTAGEDCLDDTRSLDQLVAVVKEIF